MDMKNLVLRPNCLITPSELIFVPGPRSLFFYKSVFGQLPEYLYEHGYRTQVLNLPFRNKNLRQIVFKKWIANHADQSFHLILNELTYDEFEPLLDHPFIRSLTIITEDENLDVKSLPDQKSFLFLIPNRKKAERLRAERLHAEPLHYLLHRLLNLFYRTKTSPYSVTFSNFDPKTYDRFLDHSVKLAENELYA
jgi:hypothetical protein